MSDKGESWDEATVQAWPDHELTIAYDTSLKVSRDPEEVSEMRQIAERNANITAREMKRRGIRE